MKNIKVITGWIGVSITVIFSGIWAYWGAIENFHEGWYSRSIWENLFMMIFQYLLFALVFVLLALVSLKWKKAGLLLHIALAAFCIWFFSGANISVLGLMIVLPITGLALLYYFGTPRPLKWAYRSIIAIPLAIVVVISVPAGIKVSKRLSENDFGPVSISENGLDIIWAPEGPGWPKKGVSWEEARYICEHLSEDGKIITDTETNIWRLPTVEEAVRSMMLHGENCKGVWDNEQKKATYEKIPDKESPLWDVFSQVIYYWTSETYEQDERRAYIIVYHGSVHTKMKIDGQAYLSFRAVKDIAKSDN